MVSPHESRLLTEVVNIIRGKAIYWSKIATFSYPLVFDALLGGFPSEYCHNDICLVRENYNGVAT